MVTGDSQGPSDSGSDPLIGRTLNGRFSILEPIGIGGMGRVYRAQQTPLDRVVALKVLNPNFPTSKDPGFQKRFLREASLSSKLRHPNTVTVIDYGQTDDGIYYIAMEYLEGRTLGQALAESGPMPWARALNVAQQICRSLREAHNLGVVHRDLKPANIMLLNDADQDHVKVLDFGLVKSIAPATPGEVLNPEITQSGTFLGSPAYMAPEQARNESDVRSDVYSLGVVLYQMLVGRPPFISKDHIDLIFSHHREPPPAFSAVRPDVSVPQEIEALVRKCLEKEPAKRFQTMDELLEAMRTANMSAGGHSGIFKRPNGQNTTGPHKTPLFAGIAGDMPAGGDTLAVDISVEVPPDMQKTRRRTLLLGGLVGGGVAALVAGGLLLSSGVFWGRAAGTTAPVAQAPVLAEKPSDQLVRFRLMSQPSGARVIYKGEERGTTPLLLEIPKEKGQETLTAEFTFTLEGYQTETVITGGSGEVVFAQKLQRTRGGAVSRATGGRVERASGKAEESMAETAMGSLSAPVMLESSPPPAPLPATAPTQAAPTAAEQKPEAMAAGSLAVPVPALTKNVAPTGDGPLPFSEGMSRPVELSGKDIVYTREALAARVEGTMSVKCVITKQGKVESCRVLKGLPHMNEAVVQALQSRTYKPITLQGKAVAVDYVFNIRLVAPRRR
jgi:serine/threonine-protein kinase